MLVRPIAVATCDLDAVIVRGLAPFPPPFPLGHESVAEVVEIGDAVRTVRPGDRAVVPFQPACGACGFCRRGFTANCTAVPRTSMYGIGTAGGGWGGVLADTVRVPFADAMLVKLPAGVAPAAAASAGDNIADGWRTVAPYLDERPGAAVLILGGAGAGSVPLYAAAMIARRLGAQPHPVSSWPKRLGSYPITVEACQDPDGLACALRSTEPGGHCTSVSIYFGGAIPMPMTEMYMKGITFHTGRVHSRTVLPAVLSLLEARRIDPGLITTERARWSDAAEAILGYTTKLIIEREDG
ncbi:MAG: dehydrogenase [Deltaproteobacteria bacterium]|nr:MAG: dehydrogenase [Deltaproteobacteria bacterium]